MTDVTIIDDRPHRLAGEVREGRLLVDGAALAAALGWELTARGLCRGDRCVVLPDGTGPDGGGLLDVAVVADALDRPVVVDAAAGLAAVGRDRPDRLRALDGLEAPAVTLPDLDGTPRSLGQWRGQKKLLVTFASWCGCRYDLPGWQALHDELADESFTVVAVALDDSADDVRPFVTDISYPVLLDRQHLLSELLAISNVPTVVWIDEEDRIVRPNGVAFGTDLFTEFTGVESEPHRDAVRRWVRHDDKPLAESEARAAVPALSEQEVLARLHFRVAAEARRRGDEAAAARHFATAAELAPYDFTVRRAAMPLVGEDPFGETFFAFYEQWREAGSPYHGLSATDCL